MMVEPASEDPPSKRTIHYVFREDYFMRKDFENRSEKVLIDNGSCEMVVLTTMVEKFSLKEGRKRPPTILAFMATKK